MQPDLSEVLRYLGVPEPPSPELRRQIDAVSQRLTNAIQPRWLYRVFSLLREGDTFRPEGTGLLLEGDTAARMLSQCDQVVLLVCTLGLRFDAMLRAEQARNMADAVILDACGNALAEAGCDAAEREIAARFPGRFLTDRFSPGYGTLPLSLQPELCALLDTQRRLGVHVEESCLMTPAKTVTAIIGLSDQPQMARIRGCAYCSMRNTCTMRKGGHRCGL